MPSDTDRGPLRATMTRIGDLYRAEYFGELNPHDPDARALPDSHIGTDEQAVRSWVEQMASGLGYAGVAWEEQPETAYG